MIASIIILRPTKHPSSRLTSPLTYTKIPLRFPLHHHKTPIKISLRRIPSNQDGHHRTWPQPPAADDFIIVAAGTQPVWNQTKADFNRQFLSRMRTHRSMSWSSLRYQVVSIMPSRRVDLMEVKTTYMEGARVVTDMSGLGTKFARPLWTEWRWRYSMYGAFEPCFIYLFIFAAVILPFTGCY